MTFFKNHKVIKVSIAFVLLGLLFAAVPFFQIFHHHTTFSSDFSKTPQLKEHEVKCCNQIKIQSHLQGILNAEKVVFKLSFIDNYIFSSYNYVFKKSINLSNKAPPINPIV